MISKKGLYEYRPCEEGDGVVITKYLGDETTVRVPARIDGRTVREIDHWAFHKVAGMERLVLPRWLRHCGLICNCPDLQTVELPQYLESFSGLKECPTVRGFVLHPENKAFVLRDGVLFSADMQTLCGYPAALPAEEYTIPETVGLVNCISAAHRLRKLHLPQGLRNIWVQSCSALEELILPDSCTRLGDVEITDCPALRKVSLPAKMEYIGSGVFSGCSGLRELELRGESLYYEIRDNMLLRRDMPREMNRLHVYEAPGVGLLRYIDDGRKTVRVPDGVQWISQGAFDGCTALEEVVLPMDLPENSIGRSAFVGCPKLQRIRLPEDFARLTERMVVDCPALEPNCLRKAQPALSDLIEAQEDIPDEDEWI